MTSSQEKREPHGQALRRELHELQESQHWYHHAIDLDSGRLESAERGGPPQPLSRSQTLSRLGHTFDPSVFSGPSYRLTPRRPYQVSPEAWLGASDAEYYSADDDTIYWHLPEHFSPGGGERLQPGMNFSFAVSPNARSLVSIHATASSWPGTTGHVLIAPAWTSTTGRIPITPNFGTHTLDLVFVPLGGRESFIRMHLEEGVRSFSFHAVTFGREPMVVSPG
jgi:hypothetical protein